MAERRSRLNTLEEKRRMRNSRKKRRRSRAKVLEAHLQHERTLRIETSKKLTMYKNMARSYWERWQWELHQRKESMARERAMVLGLKDGRSSKVLKIHEIDPELLLNPVNEAGESVDTFIGRGSFGVVRLQVYRGMKVAVKELLPRTVAKDVLQEATILAQLCHPYLPLLFGMNSSTQPYRIVMQYHGFKDRVRSLTLHEELCNLNEEYCEQVILILCVQIMEAMRYLHNEAKILHNDLKCNNILICDSTTDPTTTKPTWLQIMIIDFGKATSTEEGKRYHLSDVEKAEYVRRFTHISPEVIEGITKQTTNSDIYAVGGVLQRIADCSVLTTDTKKGVSDLATKCRSPSYMCRPSAQKGLSILEQIIKGSK